MKELSIVWIKRKSKEEDNWLENYLSNLDLRYSEIIVVGHTEVKNDRIKYVPFWENGLDEKGLICHKKNLGVKESTSKYCLVLHSDICPSENFYDEFLKVDINDNEHIAPLGKTNNGDRGLTWCYNSGARNAPITMLDGPNMYISGAAILGTKKIFEAFPWNESLGHGREEDVELSNRTRSHGVGHRFCPNLVVKMLRSQ